MIEAEKKWPKVGLNTKMCKDCIVDAITLRVKKSIIAIMLSLPNMIMDMTIIPDTMDMDI